MSDPSIDLINCDLEPIHIPGQIQSHGFLIAVDTSFIIRYHSDNVGNTPGLPVNLVGKTLDEVELLAHHSFDQIKNLITEGLNKGFEKINPVAVRLNKKAYNLILSNCLPYCLLELEPNEENADQDVAQMIGRSISEMLVDGDLGHLLTNTAQQVKNIIQFDRIMIYRFANDGHGEVVAEAKSESLPTLLGLHYPASDIPKQARELYKMNLTRLIANVHTNPNAIIASADQPNPLDLTHAQLRAVSPIHIQYLKNMNVDSSFSISIICHKELWGLIACHNYTPRFINYKSRESARIIGQIFSSALEFRQDQKDYEILGRYKSGADALSRNLQKTGNLRAALVYSEINLMHAVDATGAVLVYEGCISKLGQTPDDPQLCQLIDWFKDHAIDQLFYTSELSEIYPDAVAFKHIACGIMVSVLSKEDSSYLIWFKPEVIQTVRWAGNPEKPAAANVNALSKISPRNSFEVWAQSVAGSSKPWNSEEIKSVTRLREEILFNINQKAAELISLNEKLKLAYEELDLFSYTIAHDLKNPLSSVMGYAQLLKMEASSPDVTHSIDRIIVGAARMNQMITEILEYSRVGQVDLELRAVDVRPMIDDFIKDLAVVHDASKIEFTIGETPVVQGDPIMILQVFTNIMSNAVKYSQGTDIARISIHGAVHNSEIVFDIADNGRGIHLDQQEKIFDLFQRADNVDIIEGSGIGLAIVKKIMERHNGAVRVQSVLGAGSTFSLCFKR